MNLAKITQAIQAIADIDGVYVGKVEDKSTWGCHFKSGVTDAQKVQAQKIIDGWIALTPDQVAINARNKSYLLNTQNQVMLHLEEMAAGVSLTMSTDDFNALVKQRIAARAAIMEE